ncbi:MAG: endolytic transglycosylase MltG, partial [Bacteroidota bacterium]
LQADPTLVFAWQDFSIRRLLNKHKTIESPYNTYLHAGLPPGPICLPSATSIDAVLHYRLHDYMFFCAKDDLSGYHAFAVTTQEHTRNAKRYQHALNRMNIK